MPEYIYKRFKVHYTVQKTENNSYCASGSVDSFLDENGPILTQKFQTEAPTKTGSQEEIKKLINEYIDFEWQQFREKEKNK